MAEASISTTRSRSPLTEKHRRTAERAVMRETVSREGGSPQADHQQSTNCLPSPMVRLHIRLIPEDDAFSLHSGDPLANGTACQPDLASESFQGKPGILLKKTQDLEVLFVHVGAGLELLQAKDGRRLRELKLNKQTSIPDSLYEEPIGS